MSTVPSPSRRASLERAVARYEQALPLAAQYLAGRGIDEETARRYRFGVVTEASSEPERDYTGRLAIPYLTRAGVATVRYRALGEGQSPKYLSLPGDTGKLYNTGAFFVRSQRIAVVEGELDALTVHEFAGIPAVGLQGAQAWKPAFLRCFCGYRQVLVVGDGDEAGRKFTDRIVADLGEIARPVYLPDGTDCNDLFTNEGPEGLAQALGI